VSYAKTTYKCVIMDNDIVEIQKECEGIFISRTKFNIKEQLEEQTEHLIPHSNMHHRHQLLHKWYSSIKNKQIGFETEITI
jgi:hypothetical protein